MSARSVGTAAAHWIGLVGLGRRLMRHCGAVVRLFLAGAVLAVATFIAPGLASATPPANSERPTLSGDPYVGSTLYATAGRWSGVPAPTYSYRWQYQASDGGWPDIAGATGPTYEIQPADLGTVIRVNVTATNSDGSAEQISEATAQIKNLPVTPPGPPDGLTAAVAPAPGVGSGQVELSWSPVASNGGLRVGDYVIQRSTDGRTWTTVADGVSANRRAVVSQLVNGTAYRFRVAAINAAGQGPWSTAVRATPRWIPATAGRPAAAVAPVPRVGPRQVRLTWRPPASNSGARITDYVIQGSLEGRTWRTVNDGVSVKGRAVVSRLTNGSRYRFRVAAVNGVGQGPWSAPVRATPRWKPTRPTQLRAAVGSRQVRLTWGRPVSNRGARITDYVVQYSRTGLSWTTVRDGVSTGRRAVVRRLNNGTPYLVRVAATNAVGRSPWSRTLLATPQR